VKHNAIAPHKAGGGQPTGMAILGCGFVADFYMASLANYPNLRLLRVYDNNSERLSAFSDYYGIKAYRDIEEMLSDPSIEMVLNLTNPRSHFDLTKACIEAGKHVYSEKPLSMCSERAAELVHLAKQCGLYLAAAPCSMLGETAQTMWKALKGGAVGPVRLVYANFDAGMIHRLNPTRWRSVSGALWPAKDEFETGCTYEHAGYLLSWLAAFFGPAKRVQGYASCRIQDKGILVDSMAPDFSVACIEYDNDIIARVTCGIVAPVDKSLIIIGENGVIYTKAVRNDASPVYLKKTPPNRIAAGIESRLKHMQGRIEDLLHFPLSFDWQLERKYRYASRPKFRMGRNKPVDFLRGPAELAQSVREGRRCRLSPELGLHMTELIETLQYPERFESKRTIKSTFEPIQPLP
jgi:predicted dehydrogenase